MGDLFTALQTGIVDGSYGNGPEVVYLQFRDVIKSYIPIRAQSDIFFLVVNKDAFEDIDAKDQKIITDLASKFEKIVLKSRLRKKPAGLNDSQKKVQKYMN